MAFQTDGGGAQAPSLANNYVTALDSAAGGGPVTSAAGSGVDPLTGKPIITYRRPGGDRSTPGSANAAEYNAKTGRKEPWATVSQDTTTAGIGFWAWPEKDRLAFAKKAWYLGLVASPADVDGAQQAWTWAVEKAGEFALAGNPMDPNDVMDLLAAGSPTAVKQRQINLSGGTVTQKQRQINLTDPVQAKALITQAFQQAMGRDPTDAEYRTMLSSLHGAESKSPTVTATTTKYDNAGNPLPDSTSTTSGGVDPSAFVQQAAQADPEAAQYQAGTFYFNTLMKALSSPVQ